MTPVEVEFGNSPLILAMPHSGTFVPDDIQQHLNEAGQALRDTDWHIDQLYDGLVPDVTTVRANFHRYVIDANRDPSGQSLYPGQATTGLVPLTDFDGNGIWHRPPDDTQTEQRRLAYHAPYHRALAAQMQRVKSIHGFAILYDCHSIRSKIPYLFDGLLPDFNIGTNLGQTCAPQITASVLAHCQAAADYNTVLNGRFIGGWTTRHYGRPEQGIHAIQMELAQSNYLENEAAPWTYDQTKAARLREVLEPLLTTVSAWRPN